MSARPRDSTGRFDATPSLSSKPLVEHSIHNGLKVWTGRSLTDARMQMVEEYFDTLKFGFIQFNRNWIDDINILIIPAVAFKTGRLRGAYIETVGQLQRQVSTLISGITTELRRKFVSTLELSRILQSVEYSKFHIVEFSGKLSYADATTGGTRPISFQEFKTIFRLSLMDTVLRVFLNRGWNPEVGKDTGDIAELLERTTGGSIVS